MVSPAAPSAVPALVALYLWRIAIAQDQRSRIYSIQQACATFLVAFAVSGWWYIYNRVTTGAWSGLSESVTLYQRQSTWRQFMDGIASVQWIRALDSILVSRIWFGGWSSLSARSWMYHFFFLIAGFAGIGIVFALTRKRAAPRSLIPLLSIYGFFWVGQLYNVLLLFMSKGVSTSMGWYMYAVISAEIVLLIFGVRSLLPSGLHRWASAVLTLCLAALDLYTVNLS